MLPSVEINYLAVLAAAIVSMAIGMAWYSEFLFGSMWMKLMGFTSKDIEKGKKEGMGKLMLAAFVGSLVMSYILSLFIKYVQASTTLEGLEVGFWLWLGFLATSMLNSVLWEGKPTKLYLINVSHQLVSMLAMSLILILWI